MYRVGCYPLGCIFVNQRDAHYAVVSFEGHALVYAAATRASAICCSAYSRIVLVQLFGCFRDPRTGKVLDKSSNFVIKEMGMGGAKKDRMYGEVSINLALFAMDCNKLQVGVCTLDAPTPL